jgi:hypothetical protein
MDEQVRYVVYFEGLSTAEAGRATEGLQRSLREVAPAIQTSRVRTTSDTLDFGASLAVVLAAPAVVELAKGISNWLARSLNSKVTIKTPNGEVIVENISARDAPRLAEKLQQDVNINRRPG